MEFDEVKAFTTLLTNLGRKKRTANLLEIAEYCGFLKERYGSWARLAERIQISENREHISSEMLREFGSILTLPDEVKQMIRDNKITSVDVCYRISKLTNSEDQKALAAAVVDQGISSSDVRAAVEYKLNNPDVSVEHAARRVLESKTKVVTHHVVIMELRSETFTALKEKADALVATPKKIALEILTEMMKPEWIVSFGIRGNDLFLRVVEDGYKALDKTAEKMKVELKDLADALIRKRYMQLKNTPN